MQHVDRPVASRVPTAAEPADALGYRRRVPSVVRVAALVACVVLAALGASACGSSSNSSASGFCNAIRQPNAAFDSLDATHARAALDAFDRVAAKAPPRVAADLHVVSSFQRLLRSDPAAIQKNPTMIGDYGAATKRIDAYLHDTCGLRIPPFGRLF